MPLTVKQVDSAGPGMHGDGQGLYLQCHGADSKSWLYRYKLRGKERWMGLGPYPAISLKLARELAAKARTLRAQGIDPIDERNAGRAATAPVTKPVTFKEYAATYIASHKAAWTNPKHAAEWEDSLKRHVFPLMGDLPVVEIDRDAVLKVLRPLWSEKPETANRVRGRIERILGAAFFEFKLERENPARWKDRLDQVLLKKELVKPKEHFAALPYDQMPAFMELLRQQTATSARALEFCILTAVRIANAVSARWDEIDLQARLWTIPAHKMKGKKGKQFEHRVPLTGAALSLLEAIHAEQRQGSVFNLSSAAVNKTLKSLSQKVTVHGFRSTFKDWCAEKTEFPDWLSEKALAHLVGDETKRAYQRGDLLEKRRKLMAAWDEFLTPPSASHLPPETDNVMYLPLRLVSA